MLLFVVHFGLYLDFGDLCYEPLVVTTYLKFSAFFNSLPWLGIPNYNVFTALMPKQKTADLRPMLYNLKLPEQFDFSPYNRR